MKDLGRRMSYGMLGLPHRMVFTLGTLKLGYPDDN